MHYVEPGFCIQTKISPNAEEELRRIEIAARTSYQSYDKNEKGDPKKTQEFVKNLILRGHESPLEFSHLDVVITCDRAIANELTRHRHASFVQESTRYVNYDTSIPIVPPYYMEDDEGDLEPAFVRACEAAEEAYRDLRDEGYSIQQARAVLPLCTATEVYMGANYREWRHIFELRCAAGAHPQMRQIMRKLLDHLKTELIPVIFDDIGYSGGSD